MSACRTKTSGPCPTFFKAHCLRARAGGAAGYADAGSDLMAAIPGLMHFDLGEAEWRARVGRLSGLISAWGDASVLGWFEENLPRCMALVPRPRQRSFLRGVYRHAAGR